MNTYNHFNYLFSGDIIQEPHLFLASFLGSLFGSCFCQLLK